MNWKTFSRDGLMNNNDILRRIRYIFDFNDTKMITVFRSADTWVTREQVSDWLKKEDNPAYRELNDEMLAVFLDGLISEKRGQKSGSMRTPETRLTNNIIFAKLKIALNLRSEDILALLDLADFPLGKSELSAFFRKPTHKHYRLCQDQVLRNFLIGMQLKYRDQDSA